MEDGGSWRAALLKELEGQLDLSRIHFVGQVPHAVLHDLFRVCACHVYLTVPFVRTGEIRLVDAGDKLRDRQALERLVSQEDPRPDVQHLGVKRARLRRPNRCVRSS